MDRVTFGIFKASPEEEIFGFLQIQNIGHWDRGSFQRDTKAT